VGEHDRSLAVVRQLQAELSPGAGRFNLIVAPGTSFNPMNTLAAQEEARRIVMSLVVRPHSSMVDATQPRGAVQP